MKSLIMTNGDYGDLEWYKIQKRNFQYIICADGGANWARKLDITPNIIVGDMDSISGSNLISMKEENVELFTVPPEKDFTDTQLGFILSEEKCIKEITVWGGVGSRLDHTLANILSTVKYVMKGIQIQFESPTLTIHVIKDRLSLKGNIGDIISVLALGERAEGVYLKGFKYPLDDVILEAFNPIGVSNIMTHTEATVQTESGILAVFHNHQN